MQKLVVLGACSGIAQEVQKMAAQEGKELLLVSRSKERLEELRQDLLIRGACSVLTYAADFDDLPTHSELMQFVSTSFPDFDTVLLAYGSMLDQPESERSAELTVRQLQTDLISATSLLTLIANYFENRGIGSIGVITSVAGDHPRRANYIYGTAKAGLTFFLAGLRTRFHSSAVNVITIKPGPVHTKMTAHLQKSLIFSEPSRVARDIYRALNRRAPEVVYSPFYWRYVMLAVRLLYR